MAFNFLESTEAKHSLARNAHHVQKLTVGRVDMAFLYNCLLAFQDLDAQSKGRPVSFPPYLPPPDICFVEAVPPPPMYSLRNLNLSLGHICAHSFCPYQVPSFYISRMTVAQACWIISLSPNLVNLRLDKLTIKEHREVRLLGETIFELTRLHSLELKMFVRRRDWYRAGSTIVFNCPRAIQKLWIDLVDLEEDGDDDEMLREEVQLNQYHHQLQQHQQQHQHYQNYYHVDMEEEPQHMDENEMDYDGDSESDDGGGWHHDSDHEMEEDNMDDEANHYDDDDEDDDMDHDVDVDSDQDEDEGHVEKAQAVQDKQQQPQPEQWNLRLWESEQGDEDELMSRPGRCEPLMELVDVRLWHFPAGTTEDELIWLYEHCFMVEKLTISSFEYAVNPKVMANVIKMLCPRIRRLAFASGMKWWSGTMPFEVLMAIPDQQLREIDYKNVKFKMTEAMAQSSIQRHSETLTAVVFQGCQQVSSKAIRVVLTQCSALQDFQVTWDEDIGGEVSFINLSDAIVEPWASNKISQLSLTIAIPRLRREPSQRPYYSRSPKCVLTAVEKRQFAQLEALYHQLACLREMVYLNLRALTSRSLDDGVLEDLDYFETVFPAMLSLGDQRTGQPGFLELFGGWTRLRELKGSFNVNTSETMFTMGCLEATWMSTRWPVLEKAEFQNDREDAREIFEWLEDYRKHDNPSFTLG
ncbi:hypothetical protein BGX33_008581 [Mortierella sp. NVP41]|nr:hypothetical protein BGX33_008581 [Mortierella sp. NVP41]